MKRARLGGGGDEDGGEGSHTEGARGGGGREACTIVNGSSRPNAITYSQLAAKPDRRLLRARGSESEVSRRTWVAVLQPGASHSSTGVFARPQV